jgi:hypothetical protein
LQARVEFEFAREANKEGALRERRTALAENPFAFPGKQREKRLGQHQLQDCIAEKLEPLIALGDLGMLRQIRRVRESEFEQRLIAKRVIETDL